MLHLQRPFGRALRSQRRCCSRRRQRTLQARRRQQQEDRPVRQALDVRRVRQHLVCASPPSRRLQQRLRSRARRRQQRPLGRACGARCAPGARHGRASRHGSLVASRQQVSISLPCEKVISWVFLQPVSQSVSQSTPALRDQRAHKVRAHTRHRTGSQLPNQRRQAAAMQRAFECTSHTWVSKRKGLGDSGCGSRRLTAPLMRDGARAARSAARMLRPHIVGEEGGMRWRKEGHDASERRSR